MIRKINVRKTTKFKRSIKAISPVIATLLMIAIAVVASLVVYAWVTGYMGTTTSKAGKAIQIQSFAVGTDGLHVYVQNVGQGALTLSTAYVNSTLQNFTPDSNFPDNVLPQGDTADILVAGTYNANDKIDIKITTTEGTFMTTAGTVKTAGSASPGVTYAVNFALGGSGGLSTNPAVGPQNVGGPTLISATANTGSHFTSWTSSTGSITFADANANPTTASINGAGTITANFAADTGNNIITTTTLAAISASLTPGQTGVTFSGTVSASTAVPDGRPVALNYSTSTIGPWTTIATVNTASGGFSGSFTAPAAGTYYFQAYFAAYTSGTNTWQTSTSTPQQTITVGNSFATTTTLAAISASLTPGQTGVTFSGTVSASTAVPDGRPVALNYSTSTTGPWTTIATVNTASGGFSGSFTAPAAGTYYFQAYFAAYTSGTNTWQTSTSTPQQTITVASGSGIVQVHGPDRGTSAASNSIAFNLANTPTSGNKLIAVIGTYRTGGSNSRTVTSITETGVTWAAAATVRQTDNSGSDARDVEIWIGTVNSGASKLITIALTDVAAGAVADICEYSGLAASPVDKTAGANGNSVSPSTGTTTTTAQNSELWIGGITVQGNYAQTSPTNSFTNRDGATYNSAMSLSYLEKIVSAAGQANSGTTITNSQYWVGCIATFKGT